MPWRISCSITDNKELSFRWEHRGRSVGIERAVIVVSMDELTCIDPTVSVCVVADLLVIERTWGDGSCGNCNPMVDQLFNGGAGRASERIEA